MRRGAGLVLPFALVIVSVATAHADDPTFDYGLTIQPDMRFRLEDVSAGGGWYDKVTLPGGVERAATLLSGKLKSKAGKLSAVVQADVLLVGMGGSINSESDLAQVAPNEQIQVQIQSAYVEAKDLFVHGLDLRLGQQVVAWGVADQFNPTNNLNSDDLRDPLLFGRQAGNFMLNTTYWLPGDVQLQGVVVPVFKPAILPVSSELALASIDRIPFTNANLRYRVESEMAAGRDLGFPTVLGNVNAVLPDLSINNAQVGGRVAFTIAEQDISLSYYNGRTDFPQPVADHTRQVANARCNSAVPADCIMGTLATDVTLAYPRMQVAGLNVAGELASFGYRIEAALIFPQASDITLTNDTIVLGGTTEAAGEYDYNNDGVPGGTRPLTVDSTPFPKWTVGVDRAIGKNLYLNVQWVHGLVDEYGTGDTVASSTVTSSAADTIIGCAMTHDGTTCAQEVLRPRISDYAVVGADLKLMNEALLVRLFTIVDLSGTSTSSYDPSSGMRTLVSHSFVSPEGFSALAYPEVRYRLESGYDISIGALLLFGRSTTKFGDPAAGGSLTWLRLTHSI